MLEVLPVYWSSLFTTLLSLYSMSEDYTSHGTLLSERSDVVHFLYGLCLLTTSVVQKAGKTIMFQGPKTSPFSLGLQESMIYRSTVHILILFL